jgi:ribosome maturation factor RimP
MTTQSASKETVVAQVLEIAERVGAPEGIEIVDVELKGAGRQRLLRIYIDKPAGVSHGDCEFISRNVGTILDIEDVVPGVGYSLEVSSPGVERPLRKIQDFERFVGRPIKVHLKEPVADRRQWEGILAGFEAGIILLQAQSGESIRIEYALVDRANLKFEW